MPVSLATHKGGVRKLAITQKVNHTKGNKAFMVFPFAAQTNSLVKVFVMKKRARKEMVILPILPLTAQPTNLCVNWGRKVSECLTIKPEIKLKHIDPPTAAFSDARKNK